MRLYVKVQCGMACLFYDIYRIYVAYDIYDETEGLMAPGFVSDLPNIRKLNRNV